MVSERLRRAVSQVSALPEDQQEAVAAVLERLLRDFNHGASEPPQLRPELEAIVEQSIRDHAEMLEYLNGTERIKVEAGRAD